MNGPCDGLRSGSIEGNLDSTRSVITRAVKVCRGTRVVRPKTLQELSEELMAALSDLEAMLATRSCQRSASLRAEVFELVQKARASIDRIDLLLMGAPIVEHNLKRHVN